MIKCEDCGSIFETPASYQDRVGEFWGMPAYETRACCPNCGSDDIYDIEESCDENGILDEVEIEEEVNEGYLEYVTYTSDWYYEKCNKDCENCKFYNKQDKLCKWEV